jgi:NADH-quinone oxidoreductase subunit L
LLSGFFSKDEILGKTFAAAHGNGLYYLVYGVGILTALLTAFYMTRLSTLTFSGKPRFDAEHHPPHESPALMTVPLWALAILAIVGGYIGIPEVIGHGHYQYFTQWLSSSVTNAVLNAEEAIEWGLMGLSIVIAAAGVFAARSMYTKKGLEADANLSRSLGGFYTLAANKFKIDELYNAVIIRPLVALSRYGFAFFDRFVLDGLVDLSGWSLKQFGFVFGRIQTGVAQTYAVVMMLGVLGMLAWLVWG